MTNSTISRRDFLKLTSAAGVLCTVGLAGFDFPKAEAAATPQIWCNSHVSNVGWMGGVQGPTTSGTTGQARACESIIVGLASINCDVQAFVHQSNIGDWGWTASNTPVGYTGRSLPLEGIGIRLSGAEAVNYHVEYRVHMSNAGWGPWTRNGLYAGTKGEARPIEAFQACLISTGGFEGKLNRFLNESAFKIGTSWGAGQTPKTGPSTNSYSGCAAFAYDYSSYLFGKAPREGQCFTNLNDVRTGDVLVWKGRQHWAVVQSRSGNSVTLLHGNWTNGKVCQSSYSISALNSLGNDSRSFDVGYHFI